MCYNINRNFVGDFMDYQQILNDSQYQAVIATEGPVMVSAGAGSGKTRVLTYRVAYMLTELHVAPHNIVAITFTNKAANEMKERIVKFEPNGKDVNVSTIHSLCARLLRQYISYLPEYKDNFSIYTDKEQKQVFKDVFVSMSINKTETQLKDKILNHFYKIKNDCLDIDEYCNIHKYFHEIAYVKRFYEEYSRQLIKNNAMDFDDLLINLYKLLKTCDDVRISIQKKFMYLLVDEFQDTNNLQYEILKIMTNENSNIFAVGDEDQSIYSWRGANADIMMQFLKDFPDTKVVKLEKNYRSTKSILDKANELIKNNHNRLEKELYTDNDGGESVEYYSGYEESEEAEYVARHIYMLHNQGVPYNEMAILMRLNALTRPFEEKLLSLNIPHKIYNGFKFYDRAEIKATLAYLTAITNPSDNNNLLKIINFPKRGIGETSIAQLVQLADAKKCSLKEIIIESRNLDIKSALKNKLQDLAKLLQDIDQKSKELGIYDLIFYIVDEAKIRESFDKNDETEYERFMNVNSLIDSIREFENLNPEGTIVDYLQTVSLTAQIDEEDNSNGVVLATVHGAKGLEFDVVFIVGLEEKIFPISRDEGDDLEEERRLMYVAITRAKKKLYLTNAKSRFMYGKREPSVASRFLKELGMIKDKAFDYVSPYGEYANRIYGQKSYGDSSNYNNYSNGEYNNSSDYNSGYGNSYSSYTQSSQGYVANYSKYTTKSSSKVNNYVKNNLQSIPKKVDINSIKGLNKGIAKTNVDLSKAVVGAKVYHPKFGGGVIVNTQDVGSSGCVTIDFEAFGKKALNLEYAPITFLD